MSPRGIRRVLSTMIAVRDIRLDGLDKRRPLTDGARSYVLAECAALRDALERLELLDETQIASERERIEMAWSRTGT